ncbi:MAG: N-acetylmuramoyl-L-alanine amidase-like domain-containing protein, partial [Emticicia sp.]
KNAFSLFFTVFTLNIVSAQNADETVFMQKMKLPKGETKAQTAIMIAKSFMGQPYKAGTLDALPNEQLVCNLRDFDCWTFVESVTAMTLTKYDEKPNFEKFNSHLKNLRYRKGKLNGYGSRIHYFKEWMIQAEDNNIAQEMTPLIGGIEANKDINFMTSHRNLYAKLQDSESFFAVEKAQKTINTYDFFYIPKNKVAKIESEIHDGDIIGITSGVEGLDFNHEGFAIKQNGRIHLLHASFDLKKVMITTEPLADYLNRIKKHSGITVLRLL